MAENPPPPDASEPASALEPGDPIGGSYEIVSLLGRGGMGEVWEAKHVRLAGRRVAVKVLHGRSLAAEDLARFRHEAEIAARIGHPNIVDVLDFDTLPTGEPYIVMEHLEGESLAARLRHGALSVEDTLAIARQVGAALHAAHRYDVVHRDLKPDNVFLCRTDAGGRVHDRVKVLDFGVSKIRGSQTVQTQDAVLLGTPQYMAPEQATGRNTQLDARCDIFALGSMVYEMLTGEAAFQGDQLLQVLYQVVNQAAPPLSHRAPGTPETVIGAVERAMEKDPGARYQTMSEFVEALTGKPLETLDGTDAAPSGLDDTLASTDVDEAALTPVAPASVPPPVETKPEPRPPRDDGGRARALVWLAVGVVAVAVATWAVLPGAPPPTEMPLALATPDPPDPPAQPMAAAPEPEETVTADAPDDAASLQPREEAPQEEPPPPAAKPVATKPVKKVGSAPPLPRPGAVVSAKGPLSGRGKAKAKARAPAKPKTMTKKEVKEEPKPKTLPPEVQTDLDGAKAALRAGRHREARRLARRSLPKGGQKARAIIARSYCAQRDIGGARAALHKLKGATRRAVQKYCKAKGLDL